MTLFGDQTKKTVKTAWAGFCTHNRITDASLKVRQWLSGSAPTAVLTYHRILPEADRRTVYSTPHIITTPEDFEAQIRFLANHYQLLTLERYAELRRGPAPMPLKCAAVTFDDGWRDNYIHAFPILKKYKVPATIFLTTGFIGRHRIFWQERLRFLVHALSDSDSLCEAPLPAVLRPWAEDLFRINGSDDPQTVVESIIRKLKGEDEAIGETLVEALNLFLDKPPFPMATHAFLTWDQVREMAQHHIAFGSHTHHHRLLTGIPPEEIQKEILESKKCLETELGRDITTFAYPGGMYRPEIFKMLETAGYRLAVTTTPGLNSRRTHPYQLRRINMASERFQGRDGRFSEALFAARLTGVLK